ncbi:MAG: M23 family metallopeptidase [Oscillochloridaceae bacterium umkhey_bin13]
MSQRPLQISLGQLIMIALGSLLVLFVWARSNSPSIQATNWRGGGTAQAGWNMPLFAREPAADAPLAGMAVPRQDGRGMPGDLRPWGNPLRAPNSVMTQGYGVGTHAPAHVWGAIDLALDGNGDGIADPSGTWNQPIYATHHGTVRVTPNSYPAGNHVWVTNDAYRTGYAHLASFAVQTGQVVEPGDLLGYIGSTGMSSGPHLDYQVWVRQDGTWVNVNPLDHGALELILWSE